MCALSIRRTLQGRQLLLTGCSGHLGKVLLTTLLCRLPEIGRLYVLLRPQGDKSATERFEQLLNSSPAFRPLHERYGARLADHIRAHVEIIDGDVTRDRLGLTDEVARKLLDRIDLIVNCAGLVDFNPDLRRALGANVDGTINVARFAKSCAGAALLQVSTCYVAGEREGRIPEQLFLDTDPRGEPLDAPGLYEDLQRAIASTAARHSGSRLKLALVRRGTRLANERGWVNTYTLTKALAEALLAEEADDLPYTVFRPAIVESALRFPFAGWNEGFNTSAPLVYLMGNTWLRHLPAKPDHPFDLVPVDLVVNGLLIAATALLRGEHAPVYQCGTSDLNLFTVNRACDLTGLGRRRHFRERGEGLLQRLVQSHWYPVSAVDHPMSLPQLRSAAKGFSRFVDRMSGSLPAALGEPLTELGSTAMRADREMARIRPLLEAYDPFIAGRRWRFMTRALKAHDIEEADLRFTPEEIDWRGYWLDVHMPGLRRWCWPLFEGRRPEEYVPAIPARLLPQPRTSAAADATVSELARIAPSPALDEREQVSGETESAGDGGRIAAQGGPA